MRLYTPDPIEMYFLRLWFRIELEYTKFVYKKGDNPQEAQYIEDLSKREVF